MASNRDAFLRLANARVNRAIEGIRLVGNLSNRSNYAYTEEDLDAIFAALNGAVRTCRKRFDASSIKGQKFVLK